MGFGGDSLDDYTRYSEKEKEQQRRKGKTSVMDKGSKNKLLVSFNYNDSL